MHKIRWWIYQWGFRPQPGSIFFSPTLNLWLMLEDVPTIAEEIDKHFKE